jgi:hypothetical protein
MHQRRLVNEQLQFQFQFFRRQRPPMHRQRLRAVPKPRATPKKILQPNHQPPQAMMIQIQIRVIAIVDAAVVVVAVAAHRMRQHRVNPKRTLMIQIRNPVMHQPQIVAMAQHIAVAVAVARQVRTSHQGKQLMKMA